MRTSIFAALLGVALLPLSAVADDIDQRLKRLDAEVTRQAETIKNQQKTIEEMKNMLKSSSTTAIEPQPVDGSASKSTGLFGGSLMSNPYISLIMDAKGYVSNLKSNELEQRGITGFSTEGRGMRNGFNVDAAELFIFAPVDPYFNLYVTIPVNEEGAELEEAYFVTTSLPAGFQVKGGRFKSNTSRLNSQHPHAWDFADISLPYKAFLGSEGSGGENGAQLTWLPPLPIYTLLGIEVLQGDTNSLLFGQDDNWGPHAFSAFAKVSIDTSENSTLYAGPWVMFGSTNSADILSADTLTGNTFSLRGDSSLYGMEALWKWKSGLHGVTLQGEYLYLVQNGDLTSSDPTGAFVSADHLKRHQDGAYIQAMYRYDRWRAGARYDRLEIFDNTFKVAGVQQQFSGKPWRTSASLEYNPTEFSRIRAQFTHDRSDRNARVNNEGILQLTFSIGAHGAHPF
jgi:hypothetical protein